jgi:tRNA pseudouridine55 synthase
VSSNDVQAVLARFTGQIMQIPPMVSALRVDGRRLYELAREGQVVERPPRPVQVFEIDLVDFAPSDYPEATLRVVCGRGTYIRSLADDIAQALGGRAHLAGLRRTRSGSLEVETSGLTITDLTEAADQDRLNDVVVSPALGLLDLPFVEADSGTAEAVRHGVQLSGFMFAGTIDDDRPFRVLDHSGELLAVYRLSDGKAVPEVVLS